MSVEEPWHQCQICGERFHELVGHVARGDAVCEYCVKVVSAKAKESYPDFPKNKEYNKAYYDYWHEIARVGAGA